MNPLDNENGLRERVVAAVEQPEIGGVLAGGGIVIGSSRAVARLAEFGTRVLPVIEDVLRTDGARWLALPDRHRMAFGLDDLIHLYAELAHEHDWRPAGALLPELTGEMRDLLLTAFYRGYGPSLGTRRWRPLRDWLVDAVGAICMSGNSQAAEQLQLELGRSGGGG